MLQLTDDIDAFPQWSPDGTKIAYTIGSVWLMDTDGGNKLRLTDSSLNGNFVRWSPDSKQIVFMSYRDNQIFRINVDGSDLVQLTDHAGGASNPKWQPAP